MTDEGEDISDHKAAEATFTFTKTDDFTENTEKLTVTKEKKGDFFINKVFYFFIDLLKIFTHWDELKAYLHF